MILYECSLSHAAVRCALPATMKLQFHLSESRVSLVRTSRMRAVRHAGML